jgi:hypothetical protein
MADDRRALLTDREREILLGEANDVSQKYHDVVVTRVRKKIKRLEDDIPALDAHNTLGDELRSVVCEEDE